MHYKQVVFVVVVVLFVCLFVCFLGEEWLHPFLDFDKTCELAMIISYSIKRFEISNGGW